MRIFISAIFVIIMGLTLPIDEVAKAADVMFLFMFAQVNITLMTLRHRRPDLERGFYVPFFPRPPIIGIITNTALAIFLAVETGRVGLLTVARIVGGILLYWGTSEAGKNRNRRLKSCIRKHWSRWITPSCFRLPTKSMRPNWAGSAAC
ncbi:MAG: hypothetical protein R3C44_22705 [Chloroflexota bacterium]